MREISILAAIIVSAFVFGSVASAAVQAPPGPGAEKSIGTIGGTVFLDADANGVQDPGEWGMSGVAVHLLSATGERSATAETFSHACEGLYIFSGVLPGTTRRGRPAGGLRLHRPRPGRTRRYGQQR